MKQIVYKLDTTIAFFIIVLDTVIWWCLWNTNKGCQKIGPFNRLPNENVAFLANSSSPFSPSYEGS